jgi:hypothetical protein
VTAPRLQPRLVACSVFAREVEALRRAAFPGCELETVSSRLHVHPAKLAARLERAVAGASRRRPVVLVYGDCCPEMDALERRPCVARTRGLNCADLVLGREAYRRLAQEGAFFVFSDWAKRWPETITKDLGVPPVAAAAIVREVHSKLVYVDTGVARRPVAALDACSRFCGLPWEARPASLEPLGAAIGEAVGRLAAGAR